ncbi:MAG: hypothetical protein O3A93_10765 [Chloroflexi bacterium]|nr:hypothetical protein [Chloroflexota bacterium]MDA1271722.1 hypothetical protein [Chloroflexota bacterium]PKB59139.1 MAG: hypothetical protein BZY83_03440 [SAR202 cluster bacterium Casp-Chloro-G2]
MVNGIDESFQERLRQAESAERELQRLQPLAAEAPQLRLQKAKAQREEARSRAKEDALSKAKVASQAAADKQKRVPDLLAQAARAVIELYTVIKDVDNSRRKAMEALAIADRVDYDIELEDGEEHERSLDRDTRGLAYALAARHGDTKVKQMLEALDPGFTMLRGCNLDDPLYRDVANFVVRHAVPKEAPPVPPISSPAATPKAEAKVRAEEAGD